MQLNPARGRKRVTFCDLHPRHMTLGLCSSTPRGDGNSKFVTKYFIIFCQRFMQLNPARGRKHELGFVNNKEDTMVYAAQPREGTETPD